MSQPVQASKENKPATQKMTNYRWFVAILIFVLYTIANADRANIGVALPFIKKEFGLSNTEAGGIVSILFMAYAIMQIPGGFIYTKVGVKKVLPISMFLTSFFTLMQGLTSSVLTFKLARFCLGLSEGPMPTGCLTTVNNWFPSKEKGTAGGIYAAASKCGPVITPTIGVLVMRYYGNWRGIFIVCAIPGVILSIIWYLMVADKPSESRFVSAAESDYIATETATAINVVGKVKPRREMKWLDRLIRAKKIEPIDTNKKLFCSWNIIGNALGYACINGLIYALISWIPTYLVTVKGFVSIKMGFLAAAPFVGALVGNVFGGWFSDNVLNKRRKPTMIIGGLCTTITMYALISAPNNPLLLALFLFLAGVSFSFGFAAFQIYPMGVTTKKMYPVSYGFTNVFAQIGSSVFPFVVGYLLDHYGWNAVFLFLASCAIASVLFISSIDEPITENVVAPKVAQSAS